MLIVLDTCIGPCMHAVYEILWMNETDSRFSLLNFGYFSFNLYCIKVNIYHFYLRHTGMYIKFLPLSFYDFKSGDQLWPGNCENSSKTGSIVHQSKLKTAKTQKPITSYDKDQSSEGKQWHESGVFLNDSSIQYNTILHQDDSSIVLV